MKKLIFAIVMALMLTLLLAMPAFAWDSKLILENKNPANWDEVYDNDGTFGVMEYDSAGIDFSYSLTAEGLETDEPYSLIYYADPWPGDNPGALIGAGTADGTDLSFAGETDLGMDLPSLPDKNYPNGAKIWLVPSDCYDAETNAITVWSPSRFLFETEPITYKEYDEGDFSNPYAGSEGQFTVEIFSYSSHDSVSWAGRWNELPQILGSDVSITGTKNGATLTLEIPAGTEVSFPYRPGVFVTFLSVKLVNGEAVFSPKDMDFSESVTLTVNGETITFTEIRDGSPVL